MGANINTKKVYIAPLHPGAGSSRGKMQGPGKMQSRKMIQRRGEGQGYEKGWVRERDGTSDVYRIRLFGDMGRQAVYKSDPCQDCLSSESVVNQS